MIFIPNKVSILGSTLAHYGYTESQAFQMKIFMTYYEALATKCRLFRDVQNKTSSNNRTRDVFRTFLLLLVLPPFSKSDFVANSWTVLRHLGYQMIQSLG